MSQPSTSSQPPPTVSGSEEKQECVEEDPSITPNPNRWFFDKEKLDQTPSRKKGIDPDKELSYRQQSANFIQDMGQRLQVNQLCINTAIVYMHRFYMYHSFTQFPRNVVSTASIFLAAKVEEQPRKLEHVIKVSNYCLHRETQQTPIDVKSEAYAEQSAELVMNENILLQTLGLDVAIDHPHTHVVKCCQLVRASKDLAQTSYFMATNSLHLTTMCLQYKPTVVACVCIHLACKWSNWEIPRSKEGKDWFWYVDDSVTMEHLETITTEFLTIFNKSPSRLKKKIMSLNQTSSSLVLGTFPTHFPMDNLSTSGPSMPTFHGKLRSPVQSHSGQPPNKMSRPSSSSGPKPMASFDGQPTSGSQPTVPKPSIPHGVPPHPLMKPSASSHHNAPNKQPVHSSGKPLFPPAHHGYPVHHMNKDPLNLNKGFPSGPPPPHPGRPSHPPHPHQPPASQKKPLIPGQPRPAPHPSHAPHHKGHPLPPPQQQPPHQSQQHPALHQPPPHLQMQPPHLPPPPPPPLHQQQHQSQHPQQHQSRDRQPIRPPQPPRPAIPPVLVKRDEERIRSVLPPKVHPIPNLMGQPRGKPTSRFPEIGQSGYGHSVSAVAFPLLSSEIGVGSTNTAASSASQGMVLPTPMAPPILPQIGLGVSSSSPVVGKVEAKTELTSDIAMTLATGNEDEEEHRRGKKRKKEKRKHKDKDKEKKPKKDKHKDKHKSKRRSSDSPPLIDTGLTKIKIKLRPPEKAD